MTPHSATVPMLADLDEEVRWWHIGGFVTGALVTYRDGQLQAEGPFTNVARLCEDGGRSDPDNPDLGDFMMRVWMHAGWWDNPLHNDGVDHG